MRTCGSCNEHIPPETQHIYSEMNDEVFCIDCVKIVDYTEQVFYIGSDYIGDTSQENCKIVESYDDEYEVVAE